MSLERINTFQPTTVQTAAPQAAAATTAKAAVTTVHQQHESAHLSQLMSAALVTTGKLLSQREVVSGKHANSQPMSLQQLLQGMGNHGSMNINAQLNKTRQLLRQQKSLKEILKDQGDNPLQTHLLLEEINHQARERGDDSEAGQAQSCLEALDAEHGEEIRSGLSITPALTQAVKNPDLRDSMRKVYYEHLIKNPSLGNFIEAVLHLCGEEHFLKGLRALQQALADDIANLAQLPQEGKLRSLMESLGCTSRVNNLMHGCSDLVGRMAAKNPAMTLSTIMLMRQLMQLAKKSMNVVDAQKLSEQAGGPSPSLKLTFLNRLQKLVANVCRDEKILQTSLRNVKLVTDDLVPIERKALPDQRSRS
ncbi:HrpJ domain-containing protein [Pseudomonas congelans]|uniref:HrpJ domain-containing protein n=1 Tax=Pseudomonas congelans TaxID=200452 RepID=UPI000BB5D037|nr:HrpJ domain-containing protein [Pseudomonas congelans]PBQ00739.1 hypothetical protein CCL24_01250 [Pseudomonas congelans]